MRVKTIIGEDFDNVCGELADKVSSTFLPDVVVGVLTGGGYVGRKVYNGLQNNRPMQYVEIKVQREYTKNKENILIERFLKMLPYFILNILRMFEAFVLEVKSKFKTPHREGHIEFDDSLVALFNEGNKKVLIVDDAIDTGATLSLIRDYFSHTFPSVDVKVAVITSTMKNPMVVPDFCVYNNRTLVRFPWSHDVKAK